MLIKMKMIPLLGKMRVVIAGGGATGRALIKYVTTSYPKAQIILIDNNKDVCELILERWGNVHVINGDVTDVHTLEKAGVSLADFYIAVTGNDAVNIISSLLARKEGAKKVIVRVDKPGYEELAKMLGIEHIVTPAESTALQIDLMMKGPGFIDLNKLVMDEININEIVINKESKYEGYNIEPSRVNDVDGHVLFIIRDGRVIIPYRGLKLTSGDKIVVAEFSKSRRFKIF